MRGEANRHREMMIFDWDRAAEIIRDSREMEASAGLSGDWEYTGGTILREGVPLAPEETYVFLGSTWAQPQLLVGGKLVECWRLQGETPEWDEHTYWPESAKQILNGLDVTYEVRENGSPGTIGYLSFSVDG